MLIAVIVAVALIFFWLWAIAPRMKGPSGLAELRKFDYAHRGLHNIENGVPENSLCAFRLAADCKFGIELDLQLTKDKKIVVHHDLNIKRSCGEDKNICDKAYSELKEAKLFKTDEKIPLFEEVLRLIDGRIPMIIELKGYNDPAELCELVCRALDGYKGLYCIESFDPRIVRWFKKNRQEVVRGQLMSHMRREKGELGFFGAFFARNLFTNFYTRPDFEAYDFKYRYNISLCAAKLVFGMQEVSWTLRTQEELLTAKKRGAICIFENTIPAKARKEKRETVMAELAKEEAAPTACRKNDVGS